MAQTEILARDQMSGVVTGSSILGDGSLASPLSVITASTRLQAAAIVSSGYALLESKNVLSYAFDASFPGYVMTLTFDLPAHLRIDGQGIGVLHSGHEGFENRHTGQYRTSLGPNKIEFWAPAEPVVPNSAENFCWYLMY